MKVIFCGAHPADAEIYAFGTLFAYRAAGAEVLVVIAANGNLGTTDRSKDRPLADVRREEAEKSSAVLGARLICLGLPDLGIEPAKVRLTRRLMQLFIDEKPDVIITHSRNDYHIDHRVLSGVVSLAAPDTIPVIYADTIKGQDFQPTHFVNIGAFQSQKFECLRLHHSQKPRRYVLSALGLAQRRGKQATGLDTEVMEAFRFDMAPPFFKGRPIFPPGTIKAQIVTLALPAGSPPDMSGAADRGEQ